MDLSSWFQRFPPMVFGYVDLGLWKQSSSWWGCMVQEAAHLLAAGSKGGRVPISTSRTRHQWPNFVPLGTTSYSSLVAAQAGIGASITLTFTGHLLFKPEEQLALL